MKLNLFFLLILLGQCYLMYCQLYKYLYINENKTRNEAQQYYRGKHTDLATLSNMEGLNRLLRTSPQTTAEAWIGLSDQTNGNRTWHWSLPGVEFNESETKWNSDEPDDRDTENGGFILKDQSGETFPALDQSILSAIMGLFRDTWRWSDGSSFSFRHWSKEFNDEQYNSGQCAMAVFNDEGRWKNETCTVRKPFICHDDKLILIKEKMNWEDAL
ncbi:hypothetical protein CHARACLAT_001591 [Characodon lateralis]|uniref:C-type lectin domain-containing protein n=1 Tax=Characodon lateralis TaxID=208331 RepID=A0ABU7DPA7_9TELE|nr:hypothetical protein [Characodon lateralis]